MGLMPLGATLVLSHPYAVCEVNSPQGYRAGHEEGPGVAPPAHRNWVRMQADPSQANERLHHGLPQRSFLFAGAAKLMVWGLGLSGVCTLRERT